MSQKSFALVSVSTAIVWGAFFYPPPAASPALAGASDMSVPLPHAAGDRGSTSAAAAAAAATPRRTSEHAPAGHDALHLPAA